MTSGPVALDRSQLEEARDYVVAHRDAARTAGDPNAATLDALAGTLQDPPGRGVTYWVQTTQRTAEDAYAVLAAAHPLIFAWSPIPEPDMASGVDIAVEILNNEDAHATLRDLLERCDDVVSFEDIG